MLRKAIFVQGKLCPGSRICCSIPAVGRGRRREDAERCWGPATVVAKESISRYYEANLTKILSVARKQMRDAACLETAASEDIANDVDLVGQSEDRSDHDIAKRKFNLEPS